MRCNRECTNLITFMAHCRSHEYHSLCLIRFFTIISRATTLYSLQLGENRRLVCGIDESF